MMATIEAIDRALNVVEAKAYKHFGGIGQTHTKYDDAVDSLYRMLADAQARRIKELEAKLKEAKRLALHPADYCYHCCSPSDDCGCEPNVHARAWAADIG